VTISDFAFTTDGDLILDETAGTTFTLEDGQTGNVYLAGGFLEDVTHPDISANLEFCGSVNIQFYDEFGNEADIEWITDNENGSITFAPVSTEGTTDVQGDYFYTLKSTFVPNENYLDGTGYSESDVEPVELAVAVYITGADVECNWLDVTWTDNDDQTTHFASRLGTNYGIPLAGPIADYSATLASQ